MTTKTVEAFLQGGGTFYVHKSTKGFVLIDSQYPQPDQSQLQNGVIIDGPCTEGQEISGKDGEIVQQFKNHLGEWEYFPGTRTVDMYDIRNILRLHPKQEEPAKDKKKAMRRAGFLNGYSADTATDKAQSVKPTETVEEAATELIEQYYTMKGEWKDCELVSREWLAEMNAEERNKQAQIVAGKIFDMGSRCADLRTEGIEQATDLILKYLFPIPYDTHFVRRKSHPTPKEGKTAEELLSSLHILGRLNQLGLTTIVKKAMEEYKYGK